MTSCKPVRYASGAIQLEESDLDSAGFGLTWGHTRSYEQTASKYRGGSRGQSLNGTHWSVEQIPSIQVQSDGKVAVAVGRRMFWFKPSNGGLHAMFPFTARLSKNHASGDYKLVADDSGVTYRFDAQGRFQSISNPSGDEMIAQYDSSGRLISLPLTSESAPGTTATYSYNYVDTPSSSDRIASVLYQVNGVNVRRVSYTYYMAGSVRGNAGDLATAAVEGFDTESDTWYSIRNFHYRYWKPSRATSFMSGLKYSVGAQAYANMVAAGLDPLTATDAEVAAYADLYLEYTGLKISKEVTDAGAYTYAFRYQPSWGNAGRNSWSMKTVETLPAIGTDGTHDRNVVYTNAGGQVMLKVFISAGQPWCTYYRYDAQGTCVLEAQPSAVFSYDESEPGLVTLSPDSGLVQLYEYKDKEGYGTKVSLAQGSAGASVRTRTMAYVGRETSAGTVRLLASESVYQSDSDGGSVPATTKYAYSWQGDSLQVAQRTTTLPVVPLGQNGSGVVCQRREVYDSQGNVTWTMDERGFITYMQYDTTTNAIVQRIEDVQTSGMSGVPAGWVTPAGGGLNLITDYDFDSLGRITQELGPETLDILFEAYRRASWTVYRDDIDQVWTGMGYQSISLGMPYNLINPVTLVQMDKAGRTVGQIQAVRTSTYGPLSASDSFPQTTWSRWTHTNYDPQNQLTGVQVYFLIPPSGGGSVGTNYNESVFGYDASGDQNRQVSPGGTITRTVYHPRGWVLQTWVGTNDTAATDSDPSGGGAPGNNMVITALNVYDYGEAGGDGNLSYTFLYQDEYNIRETYYDYDFRDRRIGMFPPVGAYEVYTLDNQDRVVATERYSPDTELLVALSATNYDGQGRTYQTIIYAVDPNTGIGGFRLTSNTWYDPSGNIVKTQNAGTSLFDKTMYDGIGRTTAVYRGYNLTLTDYPYPVDVSSDTIVQQIEMTIDAANNVIAQITRERDHNATDVGALTTAAGPQPQARVSYAAMWPDQLGRLVVQADYGTNAAEAWMRPESPPSISSATVLVTLTAYDSAGNAYQMTDPQGMVTKSSFDQAGRLTQQLANYVAGGTGPDQNQETDYTYNADSRVATLTAKNSVTGDQTTQFVYGTTLADSDVASNDLLVQKIYPADTLSQPDRLTYAYDALGEVTETIDSNGTIHEYIYDTLGRPLHDCVTTLGSAVDGTVQRVSRSYEVRGMLTQITSYDNPSVYSGDVVNDVLLVYNNFGQLSADYQSHVGAVDTGSTPCVQYAYSDGSANTIRRTGLTYPDGRTLSYGYGVSGSIADALSRLDTITDDDGTVLASLTYLGLDTRVQMIYAEPGVQLTLIQQLGEPVGDGGDQYVGLDRFGRLVDQRWMDSTSSDIERVQFGYSEASNRIWRQNPVATAAGAALDEFYTNDGLQQLSARQQGTLNGTRTGISGTPATEEDFTYDPLGNWSEYVTKAGGSTTLSQSRTHNVDNEITTLAGASTLVGYDHAGNMTTAPFPANGTSACQLSWDAWNRLVKVQHRGSGIRPTTSTATAVYDGLTRRVTKSWVISGQFHSTTTSDYYYSDQWKVIEEPIVIRDTVAQETRQFVWRGCDEDKLILRDQLFSDGTSDRVYALDDGKNVTAIYDMDGGNVEERYGYLAFGAPVFMDGDFNGQDGSNYDWETLFCGYRFDSDIGLYQVRYRYLHSQLGRWLSRDPLPELEYSNMYSLTNGDWLIETDGYNLGKANAQFTLASFQKSNGMENAWQSVQLFAYVSNSPISAIDSMGLIENRNNPPQCTAPCVPVWYTCDTSSPGKHAAVYCLPDAKAPKNNKGAKTMAEFCKCNGHELGKQVFPQGSEICIQGIHGNVTRKIDDCGCGQKVENKPNPDNWIDYQTAPGGCGDFKDTWRCTCPGKCSG